MTVTNYYAVDNDILGEKTTASSRIDYLTDALGSVTATLNQSAQVVNTYRYKPYGALLAKTGTGVDPAYTWVGSKGYRQTGNQHSDTYVRARTYSSALGRLERRKGALIVLSLCNRVPAFLCTSRIVFGDEFSLLILLAKRGKRGGVEGFVSEERSELSVLGALICLAENAQFVGDGEASSGGALVDVGVWQCLQTKVGHEWFAFLP